LGIGLSGKMERKYGKRKKMRQSKKFEHLEEVVKLTVRTRCPEKYLLVDRETGQVFVGSLMGHWDRLDAVVKE
jgi:hypothetical protein